MTRLREVLREASAAPTRGSEKWGSTAQGLVFIRTERFEFYIWGVGYLERVFTAACGMVDQLGHSATGWASARWEVYAKARHTHSPLLTRPCLTKCLPLQYSRLPGIALRYDPKEKRWWDHAVDWLDGRLPSEKPKGYLRGLCPAGIAFNKLLPGTSPPSSSSAQPAVRAGSSTVSLVQPPSAAPTTSA